MVNYYKKKIIGFKLNDLCVTKKTLVRIIEENYNTEEFISFDTYTGRFEYLGLVIESKEIKRVVQGHTYTDLKDEPEIYIIDINKAVEEIKQFCFSQNITFKNEPYIFNKTIAL